MTEHAGSALTREFPTKKTVLCVILHTQTCGAGHSAFLSVCTSLVFAANNWKASEMGQSLDSEVFMLSVWNASCTTQKLMEDKAGKTHEDIGPGLGR